MIKKPEGQFESILTNMQNSTKKKPAPVRANKPTYYFDTPQGVDHITKTLHDFTDIKPEDAVKMNKETKLALIKSEEKGLKRFDHDDISTYPSDPEQRRRLKNIENLEKSVGVRPDTWNRFVRTGAMPIVPDDFVSASDKWDAIYGAMSTKEKNEFNMEQKRMENKRKLENKQDRIRAFRAKAADKAAAAEPARKMAAEIVQYATSPKTIDEIIKRKQEPENINLKFPVVGQVDLDTPPIFEPKPIKRMGLHRGFVEQKLEEGNIVKEVLGE